MDGGLLASAGNRQGSVRTPPWVSQVLALAVVRVRQDPQVETTSLDDVGSDAQRLTDSVELALPPLSTDNFALDDELLLNCGKLLNLSMNSVVAQDTELTFGHEDENEDESWSPVVQDDEEEEIFSREMQSADSENRNAGTFFSLPESGDHPVLGIAFEDPRASTRQRKQRRFLMLLLTTSKKQSLTVFGNLRAQLKNVATRFYQEDTPDGNFAMLTQFYDLLEKQPRLTSRLLPNAAMVRRLGGSDVVATLHALLLQGRVACYSASASAASAAVVALLAMLPPQIGNSLLHERNEVFAVQPCCSLGCGKEMFLESGGFVLGTSNRLLLKDEDSRFDLVLDLDAGEVKAYPTVTSERAFAFGAKTSTLADNLTRRFTDPVAPMQMRIAGQRTRDNEWVLEQCRLYFEELLSAELAAIMNSESKDESERQFDSELSSSTLFSASFLSMIEEISAPVLDSLGFVDDEEHPNARSTFCADYGWSWTLSWQATSNYAQWLDQARRQRKLTRCGSSGPPRKLKPPPLEGKAKYIYANGDEYEGDFVEGKREGSGQYLERATGSHYDGSWVADKRHGRGVLTSKASGGYIYDGEWVDDMRCGQGHSTRRGGGGTGGGESYTGEWHANCFHGRGVYVNGDGDMYDGEWRHSIKHGAGKLTVAKSASTRAEEMGGIVQYIGEWEDGKFHGIGSCRYRDGSEYSGAFEQGRRHGTGILVLPSGDRYEGQWWQGLRHGQGVSFSKASGSTREGTWKRGVEVSDGEWLITFANGDKYSGACHRGRPWGKGTCKFANGAAYTGEWVDGLREGRGTCVNPDGSILEGEWQHSVFMRAVRSPSRFVEVSLASKSPSTSPKNLSLATEDERRDELMAHPESGVHRYVHSNGDIYDGEFKEGYRHGFGLFTERATGSTYEGQWVRNLRHGSGVLTSGSKDFIYDGMWDDDERCGYGHCVISGGRETYSGHWKANAFHGSGKYTDAEGSVYEGEFMRGKKHGVGKLIASVVGTQSPLSDQQQTEQYSGEWCEGCREGVGDAIFADRSRYSGQWKDDLQHGEGTFVSNHGDRYVGQWRRGYRDGAGVLTVGSSGVTKEGQWCRGEPVDGEWTITFPDGSKFIGECVGGRPHGHGLCKYAGGDLYDGMWVNGKRHGAGSGFFANGESFVGQWENNHVALNGQGKLTLADGTVHVYAK